MELDVLNVGNMIILLRTVWIHKQKKEPEQIQQMYNLDEDQTASFSNRLIWQSYQEKFRWHHSTSFKLVKAKNSTNTFLPLNQK